MKKQGIVSKKIEAKIKQLWKQGKNIFEISQLTGVPETVVTEVVRKF